VKAIARIAYLPRPLPPPLTSACWRVRGRLAHEGPSCALSPRRCGDRRRLDSAGLFRLLAPSGTICSLRQAPASPVWIVIPALCGGGMSTAIFAHGTRFREPAFSGLFGRIRGEVRSRWPRLVCAPCYWRGAEGARLWHDGGTVLDYGTTKIKAPSPRSTTGEDRKRVCSGEGEVHSWIRGC